MSSAVSLRVLLIEDDPVVTRIVADGLATQQLTVQSAPTLAVGARLLASQRFDAVILDITLPDGNGLDFASAMRSAGNDVPILMLTARGSVVDRVSGFRHGADDYLCKPFDMEELSARLHAILRRARSGERHLLRYADVQLELITRTVRRGDIEVTLSAREAELLAYLMRHAEEALLRERILQEVWGEEAEDDSNVLNVYVNYLRNKIEAGTHPRVIHTVRGVGYMLSQKEPDEH